MLKLRVALKWEIHSRTWFPWWEAGIQMMCGIQRWLLIAQSGGGADFSVASAMVYHMHSNTKASLQRELHFQSPLEKRAFFFSWIFSFWRVLLKGEEKYHSIATLWRVLIKGEGDSHSIAPCAPYQINHLCLPMQTGMPYTDCSQPIWVLHIISNCQTSGHLWLCLTS